MKFLMNMWLNKILVFFALLLNPFLWAHAGNPLYMNSDGKPLTWDTRETIKYKVDPKGLGTLDYNQSLALVQQAMAVWEAVPGTGIQFEYLGPLDEEITLDNWEKSAGNYVYAEAYGITHSGTSASQMEHTLVIGFDNTGEIITTKGNPGASGLESLTGVLGTYDDPEYIISAHLFINGLYYNGTDEDIDDMSLTDLMAIVVHELGHALGLDHSLFHHEMYQDIISGLISQDHSRYLPSMFPRFIESTGKHFINLHPDDIATLQWMYGTNDQVLSGEVLDAAGEPQDTLIVTVRNVDSPLCQAYSQATSITCSDMNSESSGNGNPYFNGKYCMTPDTLGDYEIPVLETGSYIVDVQEIPEDFISSIAKFNSRTYSISGGAEFYTQNDADENAEIFDVIEFDGHDSVSRDIVLSNNPAKNLERIDYTFFENEDYFREISVEDDLCPLENDYEVNLTINDTVVPETTTNSASETSSATSAGCSLNTTRDTRQNSILLLIALLPLILWKRVIQT